MGCIFELGLQSGHGTNKGRGKGQVAVCKIGADVVAMESGIELNSPLPTKSLPVPSDEQPQFGGHLPPWEGVMER